MSAPSTCALCGDDLSSGVGDRLRHLRAAHPAAHRALLYRLATPWIYLGSVLTFLAFSLSIGVPIVTLVIVLAIGWVFRRRAAIETGSGAARPTAGQLLRAGGYGAIALFALLAIFSALSRT